MDAFCSNLELKITGMTCINCQNKIKRVLKDTAGIQSASVCFRTGTASILYDEAVKSKQEIIDLIEKLGYEVQRENQKSKTNMKQLILQCSIIFVFYFLLEYFGLLNLFVPSRLADSSMGYGMLFVIGLITSVHCIAMCGGINLSQCIPKKNEKAISYPENNETVYRTAIFYNLGRVISYTLIGFILGFVGTIFGGNSEYGISAVFQGILKLIAGVFMVILGLNMLELFPALRKYNLRMPESLRKVIGTKKAGSHQPLVIGLLNGLMPCGPLQSMQIVALTTANPIEGALSMFLFSLGTVPLMLGFSSIISALGQKYTKKMMQIGAMLVVVLGLAIISQGGSLSGVILPNRLILLVLLLFGIGMVASYPYVKDSSKKRAVWISIVAAVACFVSFGHSNPIPIRTENEIRMVDGIQVVNSTLSSGRYPSITVKAGVPVQWEIDAPSGSINGCNYRFISRDYQIDYTFHEGKNVIEFTPAESGTVIYSCWMGMIRGSISVLDR